jgi:hypothetical protein
VLLEVLRKDAAWHTKQRARVPPGSVFVYAVDRIVKLSMRLCDRLRAGCGITCNSSAHMQLCHRLAPTQASMDRAMWCHFDDSCCCRAQQYVQDYAGNSPALCVYVC